MIELKKHYVLLLGLNDDWSVANVNLDLEAQRVDVVIEWSGGKTASCPECNGTSAVYDFREERSWRHLDSMQCETTIRCRVPRCKCPEHGVKTVETPWAGKHGRFTLQFEAFAILALQSCSNVKSACRILNISWDQANDIRSRAVARGLERRKEETVERLGLDEKSFGKHHDYLSVMTDLDQGRVLDVVPERKQEAAQELLLTLSLEQRSSVIAVAMDMWPAYMNAASTLLPEAVIVHDKFHIAKHLNEAVDMVRKVEHRELMKDGDSRLANSKYAVLKDPEKMKEELRQRFDEIRDSNLKTARAWAIKDQFKDFWSFDFRYDAEAFFKHWFSWASRCRLAPMVRKAKMLKNHLAGLLGYVIHPITNAVTEGLNSKIQCLKANARGFRRFANYRNAILFHCGKLDMMPEGVCQKR